MFNGWIYVIKNKINNKIYIGQTTKILKERFRIHIQDSKKIIVI